MLIQQHAKTQVAEVRYPFGRARIAVVVAEHEEGAGRFGERSERGDVRREAGDRSVHHIAGEGDQIRREMLRALDYPPDVHASNVAADVQV